MMSRRIFVYLLSLGFAASFVVSCATTDSTRPTNPTSQFDNARKRYDARRYVEAIEQFKVLLAQFPGSKYAEPGTFFLGKCHYETKEYPLAEVEFERIVRDFPRGSYAEEATFMLGMCAYKERRSSPYDQTSTERAIALFRAYIDTYPEGAFVAKSEQKLGECRATLAQKLCLSGRLYLKLGDSAAARSCFEEVLEKYADSSWAEWAFFGIAESYERERNWVKALDGYRDLMTRNKDAEVSDLAKDKMKKIGNKVKQVEEKR
jgi:outer membrane assembly lipoprotein YfiO